MMSSGNCRMYVGPRHSGHLVLGFVIVLLFFFILYEEQVYIVLPQKKLKKGLREVNRFTFLRV